jgi:putative ABC transport system ATP-binding protein
MANSKVIPEDIASPSPIVRLDSVTKSYQSDGENQKALNKVSIGIEKGGLVAIMGPSGSGKTTLLNLIAALDFPSEGQVTVDGVDTSQLSGKTLQAFRNEKVGMIFQQYFLIDHLTVFENVMVPLIPRKIQPEDKNIMVIQSLAKVGLEDKLDRLPLRLSGGELQRVAIARGIVGDPDLILADEPTGNLDFKLGSKIIELLADESRAEGRTVIIASHDPRILDFVDGVANLEDGAVSKVEGSSIQA